MRLLKEEFDHSLEDVERWWIRIPITLVLSPLAFILGVISGLIYGVTTFVTNFFLPCLMGRRYK